MPAPGACTLLRLDRPGIAVRSVRAVLARRGGGRAAVVAVSRSAVPEEVLAEGDVLLAGAATGNVVANDLARAVVEGTSPLRLGQAQRSEASVESGSLEDVAPLAHRTFSIDVEPGPRLRIDGQMMVRDPERLLMPHFRRIHERATAGERLSIDVRKLSQVNSSNLGVFIHWIGWIRAEPEERRYQLVILADPKIAWQRTNLVPLETIAPEVLSVVMEP